MDIAIHPELKKACPALALGVIRASVGNSRVNADLWKEIEGLTEETRGKLVIEGIAELPEVRVLRKTYRALGKDPSRFRGSQDSLLRRILKGQPLYQVNTVVDINNLISIESAHSLGTYDTDRVKGAIEFRAGRPGESYKGIGRDVIGVGEIPVFVDEQGPFGSPTSDSERTKVTEDTKTILMVIFSFSGPERLPALIERAAGLLMKYAGADEDALETAIMGGLSGAKSDR